MSIYGRKYAIVASDDRFSQYFELDTMILDVLCIVSSSLYYDYCLYHFLLSFSPF